MRPPFGQSHENVLEARVVDEPRRGVALVDGSRVVHTRLGEALGTQMRATRCFVQRDANTLSRSGLASPQKKLSRDGGHLLTL